MAIGPGSRLDTYELIRPLGAGGMGEVWLATDLRLARKVAIKLLPAALTADPARVGRFEQEARAASTLNHPNVCTIHALGQTADGQHFIAMEYVEGETLRERLTRRPSDTIRAARHRGVDRLRTHCRARGRGGAPGSEARERHASGPTAS